MERIRTEALRKLVGYWASIRRGRAMPTHADVDPLDIPLRSLPQVFKVEPLWERNPLVFRYRLVGTGVTRMTGRDLTGQEMVPERFGEHGETVLAPFRQCAKEARPYLCNGRFAWREHGFSSESVYLPLGVDLRVDVLLCGLVGVASEEASRENLIRVSDYRWRVIEEHEVAALVEE